MHSIRCKLYPNHLPNGEGTYIAKTDSEASLSIEQVCAALKNRGGHTGRFEDLVDNVKDFLGETVYQLCDGFSVNTGYFSIHPNVGGTFKSNTEAYNQEKHPINFRFRVLSPLRRLVEHIKVEIEGSPGPMAYIAEFLDVSEESVNDTVTSGGQFIVHGNKIRVSGDDPSCGVYFESADDEKSRIKTETKLAENTATKLIGITPQLSEGGVYRIVIITQYSSGNTALKEAREIKGGFTVTAV